MKKDGKCRKLALRPASRSRANRRGEVEIVQIDSFPFSVEQATTVSIDSSSAVVLLPLHIHCTLSKQPPSFHKV